MSARGAPVFALLAGLVLAAGSLGGPGGARAQDAGPVFELSQDRPIEISASQSLRWLREERIYVASGDVVVEQDATRLTAQRLVARYRVGADGADEIFLIEATGAVVITSGDRRITGEEGLYDRDADLFVMTGGDLRFQTATETVTARTRISYHQRDAFALAEGQAVAVRDGARVEADRLVARFATGPGGGLDVRQLEATGAVTLTTETDRATGQRAVYDLAAERAVIEGAVTLVRGQNVLTGDRAEVDLAAGVSRLLTTGQSRVRGLLVPGN